VNFSRYRTFFLIASGVTLITLYAITFLVHGGFARSIAFDGGIRFSLIMPPGSGRVELEAAVAKAGLEDFQVKAANPGANLFDLEFGPDIRDKMTTEEIEVKFLPLVEGLTPESIVSRETIDASYGADLFYIAMRSLVLALILIGFYLTFRFDFPYAVGASAALIHDITMAVGFIGVMQIQPSIPVVAAVLTIVGYSINDTIVIFDRIRANVEDTGRLSVGESMDTAITQTVSRTVVTSLSTLLVVVALLFGGATSLYDFALVLLFGVFVGTYSSIFIASPVVQLYARFRERSK
jgi:preprotein translocase subunit SecF